jgi:uncharacterized membrane protein
MNQFAWALAAFVALHVGVAAGGLRSALVAKLGEGRYRALFSIASAVLLIWLIWAFAQMRADPFDPLNMALWTPPSWARHVTHLLVLLGFLLAVTGLLSRTFKTSDAEPARGMMRVTRHPFLWGVAFWALGHLISNGERFAVMLFGALGVMALLGARSIDRKSAARDPENWARFEAATSNLPFAAIVQGRNRFVFSEVHWRLLIALIVFALVGYFHQALIGVPAFVGMHP